MSGRKMFEDTLCMLGYRPEDDSWETDGRVTYIHDDDATRAWMISLERILGRQGWYRDKHDRNLFRNETGIFFEIEPGGENCSGHYLHLMKAEILAS
jgi:hypothetical protein